MVRRSDRYTYRVTWSEDDREYVGLCLEFPSLSWLAQSPEQALQGIRKAVDEALSDMKASGDPPPSPMSCRNFSGKFIVRLPPEIHRALAIEAAEQGISLNRLISSKLSRL